MRELSTAELSQMAALQPMTKKQKLERFASLIAEHPATLQLYHLLERWDQRTRDTTMVAEHGSAFTVATKDPVFQAAGIGQSVGDVQRFLELSNEELHEFSCDCGGYLTNRDQAYRISGIAARAG